MNKADNYVVIYTVDKEATCEKGRIHCFGYRVESFSEHEANTYGPHGFKLVPNSTAYRTWFFMADRSSEKREWEEVFSKCCKNSVPPRSTDFAVHRSFAQAVHMCRRKFHFFGQNLLNDSETGTLQAFFSQIVYREKLQRVFDAISSDDERRTTSSATSGRLVRRILATVTEKIIAAACEVWEKSLAFSFEANNQTASGGRREIERYLFLPTNWVTI